MWQEVYLSAVLRSVLYADDANYRLAGFRKLDPITSPDAELKFIAAAEHAFFKGWQLGSEPEIQVATVVSNHLTSGLMKYFGDSFRYGPAVNLFEKLVVKDGEVACLLAQSYLGMSKFLFLSSSSFALLTCLSFSNRRRSQGCPSASIGSSESPSILLPSSRSMRFPSNKGKTRVGSQIGEASGQLRTERVCYLGEAYTSQHRTRSIL